MVIKLILVAIFASIINYSEASKAPFITKCTPEDSECITANAISSIPLFADGIPELGVNAADPAHFDLIDASKEGITFIVKDFVVTGLKTCKALNIRREVAKSKIYLIISCAVDGKGQYELLGNLIGIPANGNGALHTVLREIEVNVEADLEEKERDGKMHFNIKKFDYTYDLKQESDVTFENLFPDDPELRKTATELIKSNGNAVVKELGGDVIKACVVFLVKLINSFFKAVPIEDLVIL